MAKKLKKTKVNNSVFTAGLLSLIGVSILILLIIAVLGGGAFFLAYKTTGFGTEPVQLAAIAAVALCVLFALSWAVVRGIKWECKNTVISGNRVKFKGNAFQLLGNAFKWTFLTIITVGIYALWLPVKIRQWKVKHMELEAVYGYDYGQVHFYTY